MNCTWSLRTSPSSKKDNATHRYTPKIFFVVDFLDIESSSFEGCHDFIIIDGSVKLCKEKYATEIRSFVSNNHISSLHFRSDGTNINFGFRIRAWAYTECGGTRIVQPDNIAGVIPMPHLTGTPPVRMSCQWVVINPRPNKIRFALTQFPSYCGDLDLWVENSTRSLAQPLCSKSTKLSNWLAPVSNATISLTLTSNETNAPPFYVHYSDASIPVDKNFGKSHAMDPTYQPPDLFFLPAGYLLDRIVDAVVSCFATGRPKPVTYLNITPSRAHVRISVNSVLVLHSFLGPVTVFCTAENGVERRSLSKTYRVDFSRRIANVSCGGNYDLPEYPGGYITLFSPGFPRHYFSKLNCTWKLRVSPTYASKIFFSVQFFDLESCCDYIIIDSSHKLRGRKNYTNLSYISKKHVSSLFFHTDDTIVGFGFLVNVWAYTGSSTP